MNRVPASLVLILLHQEADKLDEEVKGSGKPYRLKAATLRSWVHRGHITRGEGGYDLNEILKYLTRREGTTMLSKRPQCCPRCESKDFTEIGRVEGGPDTQPEDVAIYSCGDCGLEFSTENVPDEPTEISRG